jgi:6-phosphofructokinase
MGSFAVELLLDGQNGIMIGSDGDKLITTSLETAVKLHNTPDLERLKLLKKMLTKH